MSRILLQSLMRASEALCSFVVVVVCFVGLSQSAKADIATFEWALTKVCLGLLSDADAALDALATKDWPFVPGAGPGEFETGGGDTWIFLDNGEGGISLGCTVMDTTVSIEDAERLLERSLDTYFPGSWQPETGWRGAKAWRLTFDGIPAVFYVNEGLGGGAGISYRINL